MYTYIQAFHVALVVKNPPAMKDPQETRVWSLGQEGPLEEEMATCSNILAWKIPWTEEPGGLQFMGLQRVGHDWRDLLEHSLTFEPPSHHRFHPTSLGHHRVLNWASCAIGGSHSLSLFSHWVVSDSGDPMDCSLPGSSVHGILWARILEWVAISFSRGSSWPRDRNQMCCTAGRVFTEWATRQAQVSYFTQSSVYVSVFSFCTNWAT